MHIFEYQTDPAGGKRKWRVTVFYDDPTARDYVTLGLSLDMLFGNGWTMGLDYRTSFGGSGNVDHICG